MAAVGVFTILLGAEYRNAWALPASHGSFRSFRCYDDGAGGICYYFDEPSNVAMAKDACENLVSNSVPTMRQKR